ncbi:MAG: spore germination protein [Anaerobutyricum soehngenii]
MALSEDSSSGRRQVEAGIVSTIVVIVEPLTAIASFIVPNESFGTVFRLLKFLLFSQGQSGESMDFCSPCCITLFIYHS